MIEWIQDQFQNNEFFTGFVGAAVIGWIGFLARNLPRKAWTLFKRVCGFEFSINSQSRDFQEVADYINKKYITKDNRRLHVYRGSQGSCIAAAPTTYFTWKRNRPVWISITLQKNDNGGWESELKVFSLLWRKSWRADFKTEITKLFDRDTTPKLIVKVGYNQVDYPRPSRSWDSIFLDAGKKKEIRKAIKGYLNPQIREKKQSLGIKNNMGFCFYGLAGTGKTSLAYAIAKELDYSIYHVNLSNFHSDSDFLEFWTDVKEESVVLFDDVDAQNLDLQDREGKNNKEGVSIATILSVLDGPCAQNNLVLVLTTNHKDKLDSALLRKGRMDVLMEIPPLSKELSSELYQYLTDEGIPESLVGATGADIESAAFARLFDKHKEA